ncbi:MAG: hypothetical protein CM15mP44_5100 [Candidatus Neomarinimicrobiota bacterium]|nr:MAG: hypothetical protein CM15mP44_5100 [Candidatus Neomarinimicrobiota bacterium]
MAPILYGPPEKGGGIKNYFKKGPPFAGFGGLPKLTVGENKINSLFMEIGGLGQKKGVAFGNFSVS